MYRLTLHSLKELTRAKKNKLDLLFEEHKRVVNLFINVFWSINKLPTFCSPTIWRSVRSWMCGKSVKCAFKKAMQIIKSTRYHQSELVWKAYKKAYGKAKDKNKNWDIVNKRWKEWKKGKKFRNRTKIPFFNGSIMMFDSTMTTIITNTKIKKFDLIVNINSTFGSKYVLRLPTNKHKQFLKHLNSGMKLRNSCEIQKKNNEYYMVLYFYMNDTIKTEGTVLAADIGIKKLITLSSNQFIGKEFESKIKKIKQKKQGSLNHKRSIKELKEYIGHCVNQIDFTDISTLVIENIKSSKMVKKKNTVSKEFRKTLSKWNHGLLLERLTNKCEINRVYLAIIDPAYTSQQCSNCGEIHKESRNGELYTCIKCNLQIDADYNASLNIKNRFLNKECIVPNDTKLSYTVNDII